MNLTMVTYWVAVSYTPWTAAVATGSGDYIETEWCMSAQAVMSPMIKSLLTGKLEIQLFICQYLKISQTGND